MHLFADRAFHLACLNNAAYALGTIAPSIALALLLAVSLNESSCFNTLLRTIFFFPVLLPLVAAATRVGLTDYHLASWGLAETNWDELVR